MTDIKKHNSCVAIIPARYASTRFPGKPLALLGGKPIIEYVYLTASAVADEAYVATDDERILKCVENFGGKAIMTDSELRSGTDRVAQAYSRLGRSFDIVVNVQGDEPFIHKEQISSLVACLEDEDTDIATIVKPFSPDDGTEALMNPNTPKVAITRDMRALYFSRSVIPYVRNEKPELWLKRHTFYKHIGIYGFKAHALERITQLPQGKLEKAESLEQLRWLENGLSIKVAVSEHDTVGIDTPDDLHRAEAMLNSRKE